MNQEKLYYSVTELAKLLSVSRQTIHNWIKDGKIAAVKVDGVFRIHKREIEKLGFEL